MFTTAPESALSVQAMQVFITDIKCLTPQFMQLNAEYAMAWAACAKRWLAVMESGMQARTSC